MTVASFFAMLAAHADALRALRGHVRRRRRNRDDNNGPPDLADHLRSSRSSTYAISYVLIRTISRYREYAADRGSALITGAPEYLMSALQKIAAQMTLIPHQDLRQVEGMNAFFIIPANVKSAFGRALRTHPPLEKRLAALAEIAREMGRRSLSLECAASRRPLRAQEAQGGRRSDRLFALTTARSRSRPSSG